MHVLETGYKTSCPVKSVYFLGMMVRAAGPKWPLGPQQYRFWFLLEPQRWEPHNDSEIRDHWNQCSRLPGDPGHTGSEPQALHWPVRTTGLKSWLQFGSTETGGTGSLQFCRSQAWTLCLDIVVNTLVNTFFIFSSPLQLFFKKIEYIAVFRFHL